MRLIYSKIIGYLMESWGLLPVVASTLLLALIIMDCHDKPTVPGGGGDDTLQVEVWLLVVDPNDYAVSGAWVRAGMLGPTSKRVWFTNAAGYFQVGNYSYDSSKKMEAEIKKPGFVPTVDTFPLLPVEFQIQETVLPFDSCFVTAHVGFRIRDTAGNPVNGAVLYMEYYPGCTWAKPYYDIEDHFWQPDSIPIFTFIVDSTRLYLEVLTSINGFVDRKDTVQLVANDTVISEITLYSGGGK